MRKVLYIILILTIAGQTVCAQTDDTVYRQYTNWSVALGPNLTSYRINMQQSTDAPDKVTPAFGIDGGGAIEYHITPAWSLHTGALGCLERIGLVKEEHTSILTTFGLDLTIQACWQNGERLSIAAGAYTHFVFGSITSDNRIPNPYFRGFADNPRTNEPLFAIGGLNAGLVLTTGYLLSDSWQIIFDFKWGVTDLLKTDSHRLYVRPFKFGLRLVYSFQ